MRANQLVVPRVCLEPESERRADDRNEPDHFVDQNVQRHAPEENLRNPTPNAVNQDRNRKHSGSEVSETWNKIDNRIQTQPFLHAWDSDQSIHDQRDQPKNGFNRTARFSVFWREYFPLDLTKRRRWLAAVLERGFHLRSAIINRRCSLAGNFFQHLRVGREFLHEH